MMLSLIILLSPMVSSSSISHFKQAFLADTSEDFIKHTRAQAQILKEHLWTIASDPENKELIKNVFAEKDTDCINSIEDAVEAVETGTKLVQNADAELKQLVQAVQLFNNPVTPAVAAKGSATIIRLLYVLLPKITPGAQSYCGDDDQLPSFSGLVVLLDELASKEDLYFSLTTQNLKSSVNFLEQMKTSLSKFDRLCTMDKDYNIGVSVIYAIASLMTDLAELYTNLGGLTAAAEINKNQNFIIKAVGNIEKLRDRGLFSLDCNTPWTLERIAATMDDLAVLMKDVEVENL